MCEFCTEHGEGKKWYLQMKNYADELLRQELSAKPKEVTRAATRGERVGRFCEYFEGPVIAGIPRTLQQVGMAAAPSAELRGPAATEDEVLAKRKLNHFGQVIPIGDVEKIIDQADSITRIPCGFRYLSAGKSDARCRFGLGSGVSGALRGYPAASSSPEVLGKDDPICSASATATAAAWRTRPASSSAGRRTSSGRSTSAGWIRICTTAARTASSSASSGRSSTHRCWGRCTSIRRAASAAPFAAPSVPRTQSGSFPRQEDPKPPEFG